MNRRQAASIILVSTLSLLPHALPLRAAEADQPAPVSADVPYWRENLFKRIWYDQKPLLLEWWPSEFSRPAFTVPLVAASALAFTSNRGTDGGIDVRLQEHIDAWCSASCKNVADGFTTLGNPPVIAAGLGLSYLVARWSHNDRLSEAASLSAEAMVDTGIYNETLKLLFARTRPTGGSHGSFFNYGSVPEGQDVGSFPSGHAQLAFTVATVFANVYRDKAWVPWVSYGTATLISASRLGLNRHFPSDVIVGGLLGNSIGRFVVERSRGRRISHTLSSAILHLHPVADPSQRLYGLSWDGEW